jgi:hypothetical protein
VLLALATILLLLVLCLNLETAELQGQESALWRNKAVWPRAGPPGPSPLWIPGVMCVPHDNGSWSVYITGVLETPHKI